MMLSTIQETEASQIGLSHQNLDRDTAWQEHEPEYEPDWDALKEERREEEYQQQLPSWPELFGFPDGYIKCWTFGLPVNPYPERN